MVALLVCQIVLMAVRYQDRLVQQEADIALAQSILLRAYTEFPTTSRSRSISPWRPMPCRR